MPDVDLKKNLKHLYNPPGNAVQFLDMPDMHFLMIDGAGNPNTSARYQEAVEALYAVSYKLKFMIKNGEAAINYPVMPLEGLWWADDMAQFILQNKDTWKWTMMIMQPQFVTGELVAAAIREVQKRKASPALAAIRYEVYHEGQAAQIMHLGPYATEGPTVEKLHTAIRERGYRLRGKHHEIYLSDPRRSAPEKMKTIIRQPVERDG